MAKKQEKDLERLFQILADEAFLGFLVFDKEICIYCNNIGREMLEWPAERPLEDISLKSLFTDSSQRKFTPFNSKLLDQEGIHQDVLVRKFDDNNFVTNLGIRWHKVSSGKSYLLLTIQDVTLHKKMQRDLMAKQTELKIAYEDLLGQNTKLKELDAAKNRFMALTTHELRTPLSAITTSAEILKMGLYDTKEQFQEFIEMIYEQGQHLSELINDILDFTKSQAGRMDFYISQQDLKELVIEAVEAQETVAENSGLDLKFVDRTPSQNFFCYFDEVRIQQVLSNLLSNAIKYNKPKGKVRIWMNETADFVRVFVKDTGTGVPAEEQEKVFNEFETLGKVATHHKGTGLGMPITRKLLEGMGGQVYLKSRQGVGSTFWIEVPKNKILDESNYRSRSDGFDQLAS